MNADSPLRGLVDTNIVILREWIPPDDLPDELAISVVTLAELSFGPHAVRGDDAQASAERARRVAVLQATEADFDPLPFDARAARMYGELAAALLGAGRAPRRRNFDLQIAATAVVNNLPLYTTNPDDFAGLDSYLKLMPVHRPTF
ncbi:MAG: type II toxin-antitoxin system VapC family toxin [Propionibacteriaceae bacterium]|nr:type II toxin-antitoxin system VapC family toxin [Propionibacteriaceae bacterium]